MIENNFFQPSDIYRSPGSGAQSSHNVNLVTGEPNYSIDLAQINAGSAAFPISIRYSGSSRQQCEADNLSGPTSWVGFGWNMRVPSVAVNHKGTPTDADDVYFCNLGPLGGGQLLKKSANQFYLASDPSVVVTPTRDALGFITNWTFLSSGGIRMVFGTMSSIDSASRKIIRYPGGFTGSAQGLASGTAFTYKWDLSRMEEYAKGASVSPNALEFRYHRIDVRLSSTINAGYTRESYLKEIVHKNSHGDEIERYAFETQAKSGNEYAHMSLEEELSQEQFETQYLSALRHYVSGNSNPERSWIFVYHTQAAVPNVMPYPKRFLDSVKFAFPNLKGGADIVENKNSYAFSYDASHHHALMNINKPFFGWEGFEYDTPDLSKPDWKARTGQESTVHTQVNPDGSNYALPNDPTQIANNFDNRTICSERFCFLAVRQSTNPGENLTLEVWKNDGNFFKPATFENGTPLREKFTSPYQAALQIIPWNDNFIVFDSKAKWIYLYEWTGAGFKKNTQILQRENATGVRSPVQMVTGAEDSLQIFVGGDYFLVEDGYFKGCGATQVNPGVKLYVVKKVGTVWKDLNEKECQEPCAVDFGVPWPRTTGQHCMEYQFQRLTITVQSSMFYLAYNYMDMSNYLGAFVKNPAGDGFNWLGSGWVDFDQSVSTGIQWKYSFLESIEAGEDYYAVISIESRSVEWPIEKKRLDIFHYDGSSVRRVGGKELTGTFATSARVYPSKDYFILLTGGTPEFWYKKVTRDANGLATGLVFQSYNLPLANWLPTKGTRVATHPYGFVLEKYESANGDWTISRPTYNSFLFQVDPNMRASGNLPQQVPVSQLNDGNPVQARTLYGINFSPTENKIFALGCKTPSGGACFGTEADLVSFWSATLTPWPGVAQGNFIRNLTQAYLPWNSSATKYNYAQISAGYGSHIAAITMINSFTSTPRVEFALLQDMGMGFTQYPFQTSATGSSLDYVKKFKTYAGISSQDWGQWTEYRFNYMPYQSPYLGGQPEFNSHLQTFAFPGVCTFSYRGSNTQTTPKIEGGEQVAQIVDVIESPLLESHLVKQGLVTRTALMDMRETNGAPEIEREMTAVSTEYYNPETNVNWPDRLYVVRKKKDAQTTAARNLSHRTQVTSYHSYDSDNNQPLYTKYQQDGSWFLSQSLFNGTGINKGMPIGKALFKFGQEPPDAILATQTTPDQIYTNDGADQKLVSGWEQDLDPTWLFEPITKRGWRDLGLTLSDTDLKKGKDPVFDRGIGWEDKSTIEKRNEYGQPLQTKTILNDAGLGTRTANFYEGRGSIIVGSVGNAYLEDAAVLTAENGNVSGLSKHDMEGRWSKADNGAYAYLSHTGRYSIKVVDNWGPNVDLKLQGVAEQGYDYVISAWILCPNNTPPTIRVERYVSGSTTPQIFPKSLPVGGTFTVNTWQRYELTLTNADIRGTNGKFPSPNTTDYLRVYVGFGAAPSNPVNTTRAAYVDDITCRPSNSILALTAYDERGKPTSETNNNHVTRFLEYDVFGSLAAVRDDKQRIFSSQATHFAGEND